MSRNDANPVAAERARTAAPAGTRIAGGTNWLGMAGRRVLEAGAGGIGAACAIVFSDVLAPSDSIPQITRKTNHPTASKGEHP